MEMGDCFIYAFVKKKKNDAGTVSHLYHTHCSMEAVVVELQQNDHSISVPLDHRISLTIPHIVDTHLSLNM